MMSKLKVAVTYMVAAVSQAVALQDPTGRPAQFRLHVRAPWAGTRPLLTVSMGGRCVPIESGCKGHRQRHRHVHRAHKQARGKVGFYLSSTSRGCMVRMPISRWARYVHTACDCDAHPAAGLLGGAEPTLRRVAFESPIPSQTNNGRSTYY